MKHNIYEFSLFLKILCFVSKGFLNIPEYRCMQASFCTRRGKGKRKREGKGIVKGEGNVNGKENREMERVRKKPRGWGFNKKGKEV